MGEITKLGRYQLRRVLGRGAMGVVYEGFDPTLGRRVAVKTILKSVAIDADTERAYSERFVREAKAVGRLNHPNIVQVHDFGEENEIAYLVMEFIQGRELRSYFEANERFEIPETVRIMGELLDALEFAHEAGVVHRDVKPANVMLDAQRRVKLADFGVARVQDGAEQSQAGTMVGTPAFMSPEQISGGKIDRRTDIFSAGNILYQLLTGEQPFKGEGAWTVAKKIMQDEPPQPSSLVTNVSPAYDAIVAKSLAKTPARRYASAKEFAGELRGALGGNAPALAMAMPKAASKPEARASDTELEFWRSIQNRDDLDELELYVDQFPHGAYSQLARLKIAKLRQTPGQDGQSTVRLEAEAAALAKQKAEAEEQARREAEAKAQREAEERVRREAEVRAKREADEKARREAVEKAKREAEEKARQARALARLKEEQAAASARAPVDDDATVAIGSDRPAAPAPAPAAARKTSLVVPAIAVIALLAVGLGAFVFVNRKPAPAPVAEAPAAPTAQAPAPTASPKAEVSAADIDKIRRETEERIRREYADKSAAEQAVAAKAAVDKAVQEKQFALKAASEKAALDKAAADRAVAEKVAAERLLAANSVAERAAAEQAAQKTAAEKAAAEKIAAEKAAAERAASAKAGAAKAAAAKPGWPSVGDRWVYEARDVRHPDKKYEIVVNVLSVGPTGIRDAFELPSGTVELTHQAGALMTGIAPGIVDFVSYFGAFQEVRGGESWPRLEIRNLRCGGATSIQPYCFASARVNKREEVTVRAGTFNAWKITVNYTQRGYLSGEYTYWYAEDAKRVIKHQSRPKSGMDPDMDLELVSYTPAGSK